MEQLTEIMDLKTILLEGLKKKAMYISMAFIKMLSMANGKIKENREEHLSALIA